ncbi:MAG: rane protein [Microbacteriaceae bacterium]|nr:rane protein [Microbacteriaceae bacterium]
MISTSSRTVVIVSGAIDVLFVVAFVIIGRASHGESLLGTLVTLWPFLAGLAIGWLVMRAWRGPRRLWPTAVVVWLVTVVAGMLLRLVSGQGVETSFVVVATLVLGVFLVGWRAVSILVVRLLKG